LILQHLEVDTQSSYTRLEIQQLFIIGRSQAIDLMRIAGADVKVGTETTVSRDNLRYYVQRSPEAKGFLAELARKRILAEKMRQTSEELRARAIPIPGVKPQDEWTRWRDLPNVAIRPGSMRIAFSAPDDLIHVLWQLSKAIANEPEVFQRMCEGG
jgi:hypothetical protein